LKEKSKEEEGEDTWTPATIGITGGGFGCASGIRERGKRLAEEKIEDEFNPAVTGANGDGSGMDRR